MKLNSFRRNCIIVAACLVLSSFQHISAQLTINNVVNATDGVQNVLLGTGVTASNITFQGTNDQIGSFNCNGCGLSIISGIVMGTGNVDGAAGPNLDPGFSMGPPDPFTLDGVSDPDVAELSGVSLNNTVVVEFDFTPVGDSLNFNFVFASDEYPEFNDDPLYNDAFGFFLSGPGISGPYLNNAMNIALIPNTTIPISIGNVNSVDNNGFYVDNEFGISNIQADGFTVVLTAFAEVQCGQTYHIKLAIGDATDASFDSWVFLEAGSFSSNQVSAAYQAPNLSPANGGMYEGCDPANLVFTRSGNLNTVQTFQLDITGVAQEGVDFETLPAEIVFEEGVDVVTVPLVALQDGVLEGMETFTIEVLGIVGCGNTASTEVEVAISDLPELTVTTEDVYINCGQQAILTPSVSGGLGNYHFEWITGSTANSISVAPSGDQGYDFVVTDTCGVTPFNGTMNVLFIQNPPLTVNIGADLTATCLDENILTPIVAGGFGNYSYNWTSNFGFIGSGSTANVIADQDVTITLEVEDECGITASDAMNVDLPAAPVSVDLGSDLTVTCTDETLVTPVVSGGIGTYSYDWSLQNGSIGVGSTLLFQTDESVTVVLTVEDQCGNNASDNIQFIIPQLALNVDAGSDVVIQCIDDVDLSGEVSGGVGDYAYQWRVNNTVIGNAPTFSGQFNGSTIVELVVTDECGNENSDFLQITIPPVPVNVDAGEDLVVTCLDQSILNAEATGGVGNFNYVWSTDGVDFAFVQNPLVSTPINTTYTLTVTDECGNTGNDAVIIAVPPVPIELEMTENQSICLNDMALIAGLASGGVGTISYYWEHDYSTVSMQSVAPETTTSYTLVVEDQCGNSTTGETTVSVRTITPNFTAEFLDDFTASFVNTTENAVMVEWSFSDGGLIYEDDVTHTFTSVETWEVTLTAWADEGCKKSVTQEYFPAGSVYVPNSFTPDGDGINDFFFCYGHDLSTFELTIFNKWGELVYQSDDITKPWDGSVKNGDYYAPDGVYPYFLKAVDKKDRVIERKGSVQIIR
jgi:gliding motility-associated-like protein